MELTVRINLSNPETAFSDLAEAIRVVNELHGEKKAAAASADAPAPSARPVTSRATVRLGARAQKLFDAITDEINEKGEARLSVIAEKWGCSTPSLRGTMMNAMRSVTNAGGELPFVSTWDSARNCAIYTAKR